VPRLVPEELCAHVQESFQEEDSEAEKIVRGVFNMLSRRITAGEIEGIRHIMPPELREL
jgi:uncharacterized protein (DUF2267 family)